jgi:predicted DNA-binding transcriptional regulator AlpA
MVPKSEGTMRISPAELARRRRQSEATLRDGADERERRWVTGPTLRRLLDISAPTLWRWRQQSGFPHAKIINGRTFLDLREIESWMDSQPEAAA